MGLPDEGLGLSKKRSRLYLNSSKRKESYKEACLAEDKSKTLIQGSNEMMAANHHAFMLEEGKNHEFVPVSFPENSDPLVAPVASLYNIGNTCYLNCMIQTLRYTPGFIKNLSELRESICFEESRVEIKELGDNVREKLSIWKLAVCLDDLYRHMRSKESDYTDLSPTDSAMMSIRPDALLDQIRKFNSLFKDNSQHDAQELLRCLLGCLDDAEAELEKKNTDEPGEIELDLNDREGKKEKGLDVLDIQNGTALLDSSQIRKGRKRKSSDKEEDHSYPLGHTVMTNFLNKDETKSLPSVPETNGQGTIGDCQRNILDGGSCVEIRKNEVQEMVKENKRDNHNFVHKLDSSGDAHLKGFCHAPFQDEMKGVTLGFKDIEEKFTSQILKSSDIPDLALKEIGEKQTINIDESTSKGMQGVKMKEIIIVSSDDDENREMTKPHHNVGNGSQSSVSNSCCKSSLLHNTVQITKDPVLSFSGRKTIPLIEKKKEEISSNEEGSLLSSNQTETRHMITPTNHLTIQSSLREDGKSQTPKLPHSKSFLSRIQGFIPSSAKKNPSFSCSQSGSPPSANLPDRKIVKNIDLLKHNSQEVLQSKTDLDSDEASKLNSEWFYEAKLKLKRCDWLGVSPVKSVSANQVLEQLKNETNNPSLACRSKRKIIFDEDETVETKTRLIVQETRCKPSSEEEKDTKYNSVNREKAAVEKRPQKTSSIDTIHQDIKHVTRHSVKRNSSRLKTLSNNCSKQQPTVYPDCKIKPLSIQLKKMDWLVADSKKQSFTIQEILHKNKDETQRLNLSQFGEYSKENRMRSPKMTKSEKIANGSDVDCQYLKVKPTNYANRKLVQGLFGGVMGHSTRCRQCKKISNRSETFLDVSIPVRILSSHDNNGSGDASKDDSDKSRESCVFKLLKSLSMPEQLCNDNKYFCDECSSLVDAEHFSFFKDLPKVLAIHLKRFDVGLGSLTGRVSKINDHVSVPEHLPCLISTCSQGDSCCEHRYSLYSVVTHSGSSILRGHYRSYVKVTSSFNQQISQYMNDSQSVSHQDSSSYTFSQSSNQTNNYDPIVTSASTTNLIGDTLEDIKNTSFVHSKQQWELDKNCDINSDKQANLTSFKFGRVEKGQEKSWWLECDDEFIRIFEEEEFLDRLSGEKGALLGTPYILFYHQNCC